MNKTEELIQALIDLKIMKLCDASKAKVVIRTALSQVHYEAVQSTVMASNRLKFVPPTPENI